MNTIESLRTKALDTIVSYYKMYRKGWVKYEEFEGRREMAYTLFCPEEDSEEREQFIAEMKAMLEKDNALAPEDK